MKSRIFPRLSTKVLFVGKTRPHTRHAGGHFSAHLMSCHLISSHLELQACPASRQTDTNPRWCVSCKKEPHRFVAIRQRVNVNEKANSPPLQFVLENMFEQLPRLLYSLSLSVRPARNTSGKIIICHFQRGGSNAFRCK